MGLARHAREQHPGTHVVAVEPEGSLYAAFEGEDTEESDYKTEGIGTHDTSTNELFEPELVDRIIQVPDRRAQAELKRLATEEGHLVASSAGAASLAARQVARDVRDGEVDAPYESVVTVFPDSSERYLSKGIYRSFEEWEG